MEEERNIWEVIMKNYRITVNGVAYDVAVEEMGAGEAPQAASAPVAPKAAAPKAAPAECRSRSRKDQFPNAR